MTQNSDRRGMSLIEIVVALGILSVVLMSLGGLMYEVARGSRQSALATYRAAAARHAAAWIEGLEFDSLSTAVGCTSDSSGILEYTQCVTVSGSGNTRQATIVIQPTGNLTTSPDTQVVMRTRPLRSSALVIQ